MWFVFKANSTEHQTLFQSGWFVEGLLSQTLIVHMIRTQKIPFLQSWPTWPIMLSTATIMAIGIALPFTPLGHTLQMQPLPMSYFPWLAATLLAYCVLTQTLKTLYIRKFKMWL
jgi:Mg2+-importing ATPase